MEKIRRDDCCTAALSIGLCVSNPLIGGVTIPVTLSPVVGCLFNKAEVQLVPADGNTEKALAVFKETFRPVSGAAWDIEFSDVPNGLWQPRARLFTDCGACEWILGNTVAIRRDMIKSAKFTIPAGFTGAIPVAGVGFKGDIARFDSGAVSDPAAPISGFFVGTTDGVDQRVGTGLTDMTAPPFASYATGSNAHVIYLADLTGVAWLMGTFVSFDADGFTVDIAVNNLSVPIEVMATVLKSG